MAAAVMTRLSKGSRLQDAYPALSKPPTLSDIDSAFQIQEYIAHVIRMDVHDVNRIVSLPGSGSSPGSSSSKKEDEGTKSAGGERAGVGLGLGINMQSPEDKSSEKEDASSSSPSSSGASGSRERENSSGVDEGCWIYEQLRRLAQDLTHPLLTALQAECNRNTCPEMKAGEWLYLCVAHGTGSGTSGGMEVRYQCCAIDYIVHTLDSATALLNSPRHFPSRLQIPHASTRHFGALARRLSRIFAHAYYHHREAFEQAEAESSLYARFLLLAQKFDLVPAEFLALPSASPTVPTDTSSTTAQPPNGQQPQQPKVLLHSGGTIVDPGLLSASTSVPLQQIQIQPANQLSTGSTLTTPLTAIPTINSGAPPPPSGPPPYPPLAQHPVSVRTQSPALGRREDGTVVNRTRTDTMYSQSGGFDLQKFAASGEKQDEESKGDEDGDGVMMEVDLGAGPSPVGEHPPSDEVAGYAVGNPDAGGESARQRDLGVPYSTPPLAAPPPAASAEGDKDAEAPPEPGLHASTGKAAQEGEDDEVEFDLLDSEESGGEGRAQPDADHDAAEDEEEDDGVEVEKPDEEEQQGTGAEEPAPTPAGGAASATSASGHPSLTQTEDMDASVDEVDKALLAVDEDETKA